MTVEEEPPPRAFDGEALQAFTAGEELGRLRAAIGALEPGGTDFGGGLVENLGSATTRAFVAVFDAATGDHVWSDAFGDAAADQIAHGVSIDGEGDVVVAHSHRLSS